MNDDLATRYEPAAFEQRLYDFWEKGEYFTPEVDPERPKFSIVIPPPNVTGRLHIGHALVNTLQDIVVRWKRMSGFNTLWLPGTDHAGIATQMVVERGLYNIDYPVADSDRKLTVATTRPETMLGDTGIAVHPDDERYKDLIGKEVILPIANRRIRIVADAILVDPEFGTGVVKVTPSHD